MPGRKVELRGPADAVFVRLIRGATISMANEAGFDVDSCDELRVAADEACNALISRGATKLIVGFDQDPSVLTLSVRAHDGIEASLDAVAELVLTTMVDELSVEEGGTIVLRKKTPLIDPSHL